MVQKLVSKFPQVLSANLGKFNKHTVELHLMSDAKLIFFKARTVPYTLRKKIGKESECLTGLGISTPG